MAASEIALDKDAILDNDNVPVRDGSVTIYEHGTTTPVTLYSDPAGTTPGANPIPLDGSGRPEYKPFVTTSADLTAVIRDANNASVRTNEYLGRIAQQGNTAESISITPIVGLPRSGDSAENVQDALQEVANRITPWSNFIEDNFLPMTNANAARGALGLGDMAELDIADRTFDQSVWNTGASTTQALISPAKLDAKIEDSFPDGLLDVKVNTSAEFPLTAGSATDWIHGFGAVPNIISLQLKCIDASGDGGFSENDRVSISPTKNDAGAATSDTTIGIYPSTVRVRVRFPTAIEVLEDTSPDTALSIDYSKWRLIISAISFGTITS